MCVFFFLNTSVNYIYSFTRIKINCNKIVKNETGNYIQQVIKFKTSCFAIRSLTHSSSISCLINKH